MVEAKLAEERDSALAELVSLETKAVKKSKAIAELATVVAAVKTRSAKLETEVASRKSTIAELEKAVQLASISPVAACQKRTDVLTAEISFGAGSTSVSADSQSLLDELAVIVAECIQEDFQLEIEGHTDNVGRDSDNLVLSYWRANAVQDFLTENGIPDESMRAIGFGASDPIADNETADGRQKNRRIVFDWEQN
ncbi:MAG: OmpA family protein [Litoreibacter sp.]